MTPVEVAPVSGFGWLFVTLVALVAAAIVWSTLRTGIAPMPSSRRACEAMIEAAAGAPHGLMVDLGSGWGTLAVRLARAYPHRPVVGFELSFVPWAVASVTGRVLGLRNLRFVRRDFRDFDPGEASVLLCYLFREGMAQLARRMERGSRPPALVISNTFTLPGHEPWQVLELADFHRTRIHVYRPAAWRFDAAGRRLS